MENAAQHFDKLKQAHLPAILALIEEVIGTASPRGSAVAAMCRYHLETGGKRLRALLPLLVAEALERDPAPLVPFGAACEMLHNATLVHDDLQDGDEMRRGRASVWRRFGSAQAINLGDAMYYYAVLLVQRLDLPAEAREAATRRLLLETLRVIEGQEQELALRTVERPSLDAYFAMVEGKTSGLFALPMAGAAEICGAEPEIVGALGEAAGHLGVLFQIQDDVLDLYGDKGRGERGSDVGEGKRSALVVHALGHADEEQACWLRQVLDAPRQDTTSDDVDAVAALFERTGSLRFVLDEIARRAQRAAGVATFAGRPRLQALCAGLCELCLKPIAPLVAAKRGGRVGD
ncbi:MAG: polyprenyl synthetase family protein [Deltaproteobacteria bacterium]|nr:polyprenyl synthetase family protein [Deltaproteobacteria bacterium]